MTELLVAPSQISTQTNRIKVFLFLLLTTAKVRGKDRTAVKKEPSVSS